MKRKIHWNLGLPKNKKVNKLAQLMLLLLAISAIGMWITYQKYNTISPPMFIDSSSKYGIVFNANKTLCLTDENERLIQSSSYKKLGLKEVSDVKFFGEGFLLVQADGAIKQCGLQLKWCEEIGTIPSINTDIIQRIILSPNQKTFYIVQTNNSRIDKFDHSGKHLYRLPLSTSDLKYPGGGMALANNKLLLSDPKHKKIIIIQDEGKDTATTLYTLSTKGTIKGNSYTKAFSAKLDTQHRLWINLANKAYTASDTLIFNSPALRAYMVDRTPLPTNETLTPNTTTYLIEDTLKYSVSLAPHRKGMLIADEESFVIKYAEDKDILRSFGDTQTQMLLEKVRKQRSSYWYVLLFFGSIGIAGLIVGIIAATKEADELMRTERNTTPSPHVLAPEKIIQPNDKGIIWLGAKSKFKKKMRIMRWLVLIPSIGLILMSLFIFYSTDDFMGFSLWQFIGMESLFITIPLMLFWLRTEDQSIGTDGKNIFIKTAFGKQAYAPIDKVIYTGMGRIVVNKKSLALHAQREEIFDQDQLDHYIMPLLEKSKKMNEFELLSWQMKYDFWSFIWLPVIMVALGIFLYYTY